MTGLRIEHHIAGRAAPIGHFSDAVSYGGVLYLSGVAPIDADGRLVGAGNMAAQAKQVFDNIRTALIACGGDVGDLLKITIFLTDVSGRATVDQVRRSVFGPARPASTLVGISELAIPGMMIEVEATAALPPRD